MVISRLDIILTETKIDFDFEIYQNSLVAQSDQNIR